VSLVPGAQSLSGVEEMRSCAGRLTVAVLFLCAPIAAWGNHWLQTDNFMVNYPQDHYAIASAVAQASEMAIGDLCAALDMEFGEPVTIRLFKTRTEMFAALGEAPRPFVMGLALPERSLILVGIVGEDEMLRTVTHELAHIVLHRKFGTAHPADQPRWLHEGFAQLASAKLAPDQAALLGQAAVANTLLDIEQMEQAFSGTSEEAALAYAQAFTLVRYLHEMKHRGGIADLVTDLSSTGDLDRAFVRTYGLTRQQIEGEWLAQIRGEYLVAGMPLSTELLIGSIMGSLFLIGVIVQVRRRKAIRRRMEEEERLQGLWDE
jgi:hypothetical protein